MDLFVKHVILDKKWSKKKKNTEKPIIQVKATFRATKKIQSRLKAFFSAFGLFLRMYCVYTTIFL